MVEPDTSIVDELLDVEFERPFGRAELISSMEAFTRSRATDEALRNLLLKALRNLQSGDEARATAFIERAIRYAPVEADNIWPAWDAAHQLLFDEVTDAFEASDVEDDGWLDRALAVLEGSGAIAREEMLIVLRDVPLEYELTASEERRIEQIVGHRNAVTDSRAVPTDEAEVATIIRETLLAVGRFLG
jgi:hypothetical protein